MHVKHSRSQVDHLRNSSFLGYLTQHMNCVKTASILRNFFFSLNRSLLLDSVAHSVCKLKGEKKRDGGFTKIMLLPWKVHWHRRRVHVMCWMCVNLQDIYIEASNISQRLCACRGVCVDLDWLRWKHLWVHCEVLEGWEVGIHSCCKRTLRQLIEMFAFLSLCFGL